MNPKNKVNNKNTKNRKNKQHKDESNKNSYSRQEHSINTGSTDDDKFEECLNGMLKSFRIICNKGREQKKNYQQIINEYENKLKEKEKELKHQKKQLQEQKKRHKNALQSVKDEYEQRIEKLKTENIRLKNNNNEFYKI